MTDFQDYCRVENIGDEDTLFVLDTCAFDELRHDAHPISRLESLFYCLMPGKKSQDASEPIIVSPNVHSQKIMTLDEAFESETKYLFNLASKIRQSKNYYSVEEVAKELDRRFTLVDIIVGNLTKLGANVDLIEPYLGAISHVSSTLKLHAVEKSERYIKENRARFNSFHRWISNLPLANYIASSTRPGAKGPKKRMSNADKRLLSLGLCLAHTKPTVVLTGDVYHVRDAARTIFNSHAADFYRAPPELPQFKFEVYLSFRDGWKLEAQSDYYQKENSQAQLPPIQI